MARHYYSNSPWYKKLFKALGITLLTLLAIGAVFSMIVLIYGGCTNQTFLEVLQTWFTPKPAQPTDGEQTLAISALFVHTLIH